MPKSDAESKKVAASVKAFYDSYAWQRDETTGALQGSILDDDLSDAAQKYGDDNELRYRRFFGDGGEYFLDVGCGAKPRRILSESFQRHICVDVSVVGLKEARHRIGDSGSYILADMAALPFRDDSLDAALSGHSLYHIDKDLQVPVLKELYRVVKPDKTILVFYSSRYNLISIAHMVPKALLGFANLLLRPLKRQVSPGLPSLRRFRIHSMSAEPAFPPLYAYPHNPKWLASKFKTADVTCLCTLTMYDTALLSKLHLFHVVVPVLAYFERRFPHAMAYVGKYTCIRIQKTDYPLQNNRAHTRS